MRCVLCPEKKKKKKKKTALKQKRAMVIRNAVDMQHDGTQSCASAKELDLLMMFGISLSRAHPRTGDMHSVQGSHQNEVTCSAARIAGHDVFRRQSTAYLTLCCALVVVWSQLNICSKPGLFLRSVSCVRCGKINGTGFRCFLREAYIQTRAYFHVL